MTAFEQGAPSHGIEVCGQHSPIHLGIDVPRISVSDPEVRWGVDEQGRLGPVQLVGHAGRVTLVDCELAHEHTHLLHEDQRRDFWATLGTVLPDYETRKKRLRQLGPTLVW